MSAVVFPCLVAAFMIALAILSHVALLRNAHNPMQLRDWRWMKWSSITGIACSTIVLISALSEDARSEVITHGGISNLWAHIGMSLFLLALYGGMTRIAVHKIRALS